MSPSLLKQIEAKSAVRSFDPVARWNNGPVGLLRFAHATTPEAVGEKQPFVSRQSQAVMLFDGRIDNRDELLGLLGQQALELRSAPDGEIVLALFDASGIHFVQHLVGDFAIAVWEAQHRRLTLWRSAMGWRPLLWTMVKGTFAFATEPRALVIGLGLERRLNEGAIAECLSARFMSDKETFWQGIERVPPGSAMELEGGRIRQWHWQNGPYEDHSDKSPEWHVETFRELFDQALIATTRCQSQVTSQLSGGLDSSSVVCRATELHRSGRIDQQIAAISARFPGEAFDETEWSSAVEVHLDLKAEAVGPLAFNPDAMRQWCADSYQLPLRPNVLDSLGNTCLQFKADGRRVLLTGEGGDDWFDGSHSHWPDLFLTGKWGALLQHGRETYRDRNACGAALRVGAIALRPILSRRHKAQLNWPHLDMDIHIPEWIRPEWAAKSNLLDRWNSAKIPVNLPSYAQNSRASVFNFSRRHINWDNVLAYAESHGIELRHPLHDLRIANFCMGASGNVLMKGGQKKWILREAMRGTLPEKVRMRQDKANLLGHIIDGTDVLFHERGLNNLLPVQLGWVDPKVIEQCHAPYRKWRADGSSGPLPDVPWNCVWFVLATDMWLTHAFGL
jgi:asparagine synthase (glutamine-hydrolysing)